MIVEKINISVPYEKHNCKKGENAEKWHVDKNRIIACGFSAEWHLAACLGACYQENYLYRRFTDRTRRV